MWPGDPRSCYNTHCVGDFLVLPKIILKDVEKMKNEIPGNVREFIMDAFDYLTKLDEASVELSANRYLLECIANGFVKYGCTADAFVDHADEWMRSVCKLYPELWFDHHNRQLTATIDLIDQLIVIDDNLIELLDYVIKVQQKYGLLIHYRSKQQNLDNTTTLSRFFEHIEKMYPVIKDRYKGLGQTDATVADEIIMNPKTRRIVKVTIDDVQRMRDHLSILIGDSKQNKLDRKKMLMNFKYTKEMIDT